MKLTTKLIPLTSLGLTAVSLAPISLTSCSSGIIGKSFDLVKNYYPETQKHEYAELNRHEIHDIYRDQIIAHPETFVEDYFWSKSWRGTSFDQFAFWEKVLINPEDKNINAIISKWCYGPAHDMYSNDHEVISNLEITTQSATRNGEQWIFPCLSFTLEFNSKVNNIILDQYFGHDNISGYLNGDVNGKIEFYNVPFVIKEDTFHSLMVSGEYVKFDVICFDPNMEWITGSPIYSPEKPEYWKIVTQVNSTVHGEVKYNTGLQERIADDWTLSIEANPSQPTWEYDTISLYYTIAAGFTSSYYLNNVKLIQNGGGCYE